MIEGRLWYINANNNGGKGYGFYVESLGELQEKEGYNSYRFDVYIEDECFSGVMIGKKLCGLIKHEHHHK